MISGSGGIANKKLAKIKKIVSSSKAGNELTLYDVGDEFRCEEGNCSKIASEYLKTKPAVNSFSNERCSVYGDKDRKDIICGDSITRYLKYREKG